MSSSAMVALGNPFPGLRPFREGEEHLFFGRESQVDRMVDKLAQTRFLSVLGTSGTGKSSLVNCGLKPALHRGVMASAGTLWCMVPFRPGGNPIRSMARAFAAESAFFGDFQPTGMSLVDLVESNLRISSLGLVDLYECAHFAPGMNLLVVVDQFEELFRYAKADDLSGRSSGVSSGAVAFVNLLLEAQAQTTYPIYIVLTMRSDFLGECAQFDRLPEVMNTGQFLVPRLTRSERRAAIEGPIAVQGGDLSPVLLTRLVNDVGDNPDQLSILQHAINRTWAFWQQEGHGEGALSLEHYENPKVGTMAMALDLHAEEAYAELQTTAQLKICEKVFKALTDTGTDARGIRRPMPLKDLCAITGASPDEVVAVLNVFREPSRSFLMPPLGEPLEPTTVIDISHEILMRVWMRLKMWANEEAQASSAYRRVAETAELHAKGKAGLWGDPDLQAALAWQAKEQPNAAWAALYRPGFEAAASFLAASKQVRDKELSEREFARRWRRVTPYLVAILFVVFVIISPILSRKLEPLVNGVLELFPAHYANLEPVPDAEARLEASMKSRQLIAEGFGFQTAAVICLVGYFGFTIVGKKLYRRIAFEKIASEIASRPAIRRSEADNTPAAAAKKDAVPSGFWRILGAGLLDLLIYLVLAVIFTVAAYSMLLSGGAFAAWLNRFDPLGVVVAWFAWLVIVACLYPTLTTWSRLRGTFGDRIFGIRLVTLNEKPLRFLRILARYGTSAVSCAFLGLGFFGFLSQPFTPNRQALVDLIARTRFVRRPKKKKNTIADEALAGSEPAAVPEGA